MDKLCLLFFAAILSVAASQSLRCETPPVWEARLFESTGRFDRMAKISYDEEHNRTRMIEEVYIDEDQEKEFFDELFLYDEHIGFRLNLKTGKCDKFRLTSDFRPVGVPGGARFVGEAYIGSSAIPEAGVLELDFEMESPNGFYAGGWIPFDHSCVPVTDLYSQNGRQRITTHWSFFDVSLGINDPNVFVPPKECL